MESKPIKKYQRREFLKTTGKGVIGAGIGGLIGYGLGKTYKTGRDAYRENVKPYVEKGKEIIDSTEKAGNKAKDWYNKNFNKKESEKLKKEESEKEAQKRESEKTTRKGFLSKYFHLFNEHPVSTGTNTGAVIGSLVATLKLFPQYIEKKKIAKLRDENIEYGKRLKILEGYKETLENELKNKDQKIIGLEDELSKINERIGLIENKPSNLEQKLEKEENNLETSIAMIISSVLLMILSLISEGSRYSGFSISESNIQIIKPLSLITLIFSLILALIGIIKIRKTKI